MARVIRDGGDNSTHVQMSVKNVFNQQAIWLKSMSVLYWLKVFSIIVSGLVNLDQSGQGSSFSGLLASPCVPVWYRRLTCAFYFILY